MCYSREIRGQTCYNVGMIPFHSLTISRVDIAEYLEWVVACDLEPVEAFKELVTLRH